MFESALPSSRSRRPPGRRAAALALAAAVHLGLIAALLALADGAEPVEEEPVPVAFFEAAPPPPPPPPPPPAGGSEPATPEPVEPEPEPVEPTPELVVQPVEEPDEVPEPATPRPAPAPSDAPPVPGGVPGGVEGGVAGGVIGGVVGGELGGVLGGEPGGVVGGTPGGTGDEIVRFGSGMTRPEVIHRIDPIYPEPARRARLEGVVIVEAIIDSRGNVVGVKVLKGLPMGLSEAAARALTRWKFKPATRGGQPINVYFNLTVNFTLS